MAQNGGDPGIPELPAPGAATTVTKYLKSSCLFCNEWFDSQTFTEHLIHCGQVLEPCPNSCHAYVARIRMRSHLKECPRAKAKMKASATNTNTSSSGHNAVTPTTPASTNTTNSSSGDSVDKATSLSNGGGMGGSSERLDEQQAEQRLQVLERDLAALRSVMNEEIRQRLHLITDVGNLRKQNQIADDWTQSTEETLASLKKRLEEENTQRCYELDQCQNDFRHCYDETQTLKREVQHEIAELQKHINEMSFEVTKHQNLLNENILKLEDNLLQYEKSFRAKFKQVDEFLQGVASDLKTNFTTNSDLTAKQAMLDYEVKGMKSIVCETEERCDKLEAVVSALDRKLHLTMQRVGDLENHLATQQRLTSILNTRGHLIWRIKDYSKKLEEARQYDTVLHSAMFSNKQFGYALRLDIHLNGKGTWKGRNMIACLNVIAGEYDALLAWPCRLQADIIIRDQCASPEKAQDYVKTIYVRKKSDEYFQTNQYFHIPHKAVASRNYLRNDCLYVEVRVHKS